jgi:hypothetical protein
MRIRTSEAVRTTTSGSSNRQRCPRAAASSSCKATPSKYKLRCAKTTQPIQLFEIEGTYLNLQITNQNVLLHPHLPNARLAAILR